MTDDLARFWRLLFEASGGSRSVPEISILALCEASGVLITELPNSVNYLDSIGALAFLSIREISNISAGVSVDGNCIALVAPERRIFLRVFNPLPMRSRLTAQISLLQQGQPISSAPPSLAISKEAVLQIAKEMGLSCDDLQEAKAFPLAPDDWRSYRDMADDFFPRAYKRMEASGDASGMMKIAAVVARLDDPQLRPKVPTVEGINQLLEFVSKAINARDENRLVENKRQPIPESVRHEVWRRD